MSPTIDPSHVPLYSKIIFFLSNDKIIDKNELFTLYREGLKLSLGEDQIDRLIEQAKTEIGFTNHEDLKEKFIRAIHKEVAEGIVIDSNYINKKTREGINIGLPKEDLSSSFNQIAELKILLENKFTKQVKQKLKSGATLILLSSVILLSYQFVFTDSDSANEKKDKPSSSQDIIISSFENETEEYALNTLDPPVQITEREIPTEILYEHKNILEESPEIDQDFTTHSFTVIPVSVRFTNMLDIPFKNTLPIEKFYNQFYQIRNNLIISMGEEQYNNLTSQEFANHIKPAITEFINTERIFIIYNNIINSIKKVPSYPVYNGRYFNKIHQITNKDNLELRSTLLSFSTEFNSIYNNIKNNPTLSDEEIYDISESLNLFYVYFCKEYYSILQIYMKDNENGFNFEQKGILWTLVPNGIFESFESTNFILRDAENLNENIFFNTPLIEYSKYIDSLCKFHAYFDNTYLLNEFQQCFSEPNEFDALSLLLSLEPTALYFAEYFTSLNYTEFLHKKKLSINELKYKEITEIYKYNEEILATSSTILDILLKNNPNNQFLSQAVPRFKSVNSNFLFLLRIALFDFPLAFDSLYVRAKLQTTIGHFDDDEAQMMVIGAEYARINQIIMSLCASNVPMTMMNENDRFLKKQLSSSQYEELKRMAQIQPDWLEKPTVNF